MPRAHRHYLPGHIWHVTHRCHDRAFLLEGEYERFLWLSWLRKAKKRYKLIILNYNVTCNHIHLLLQDPGEKLAIARGMQLVQGQTAQACNRHTGRGNAFWGDRYHATAVESGTHLLRCLVYIDLNMVRAGAVNRPEEWHDCGYNEIQNERVRDGLIDKRRLAMLLGCADLESLRKLHKQAVADGMRVREQPAAAAARMVTAVLGKSAPAPHAIDR
ncbi:MAG: transposase [Chitinispirillaceae bacterium]